MITLIINGKEVVLNTHDVNGEQLYKAQDLLINGYNCTKVKAAQHLRNWKTCEQNKLSEIQLVSEKDEQNQELTNDGRSELDGIVNKEGRGGGTYLTKDLLFKLAAYVDKDFYDAVFKAFSLLTEGKVVEAAAVADSVVLDSVLIEKIKARYQQMTTALSVKENVDSHMYSNFGKLVCKAATGYTPKQLTAGSRSALDYIDKVCHMGAANAYLACLELTILGLGVGLGYHEIAAMLSVQTGKNKEMLLKDI